MFGDYVFEKTAAQYTKKMMLVDTDHLEEKAHYSAVFQAHGFRIVAYTDDLNFRVNDTSLLNGEEKLAILVQPGVYVPCDIRKKCREEEISFESLFPKLNSVVLREKIWIWNFSRWHIKLILRNTMNGNRRKCFFASKCMPRKMLSYI